VARSYRERLSGELGGVIDELELSELQKHMLRSRWLDQVLWMERASDRARGYYYALRLTTVIGAVAVPALVSLNAVEALEGTLLWVTFALSLLVAVSAAIEEFFHFGERWRHYRRTVEQLKVMGWQFFQLTGPYRRFNPSHTDAYPAFAARVEEALLRDVDVYVTEVVREREEKEKDTDEGRSEPQ
jgi:Protein of unknown function (DUF4231)